MTIKKLVQRLRNFHYWHLGHDFQTLNTLNVDWSKWPTQHAGNHGPVFTCAKCRIVRRWIYPQNLSKCCEKDSQPHDRQIKFWDSLKGNQYLKNLLTKAWGCSVKEANLWFTKIAASKPKPRSKGCTRKLVEDGDVEPNPGPTALTFWP